MRSSIQFLKGLFLSVGALLILRIVQIQHFSNEKLALLAERQFKMKLITTPKRGQIYDRQNETLALTLKSNSLFVRPIQLQLKLPQSKLQVLSARIAKPLNLNPKKVLIQLSSKKNFLWVKRQLNESEQMRLKQIDFSAYGDAIGLSEENKRFYPNKDLASHILGGVNVDGKGIEGLELFYNDVLSGETGKAESTKDALGRNIFKDHKEISTGHDGLSLQLTIDKSIQYATEKALMAGIEKYEAKTASAIVADASTGEVLALANVPSFDPNSIQNSAIQLRRNRALTDLYEPGSTFKPLIVASAMNKGLPPSTQIFCENGSFKVKDRTITEAEAHEKFQWLNFGEILKFSSNIGAAKIGLALGTAGIKQLLEQLNLSRKTGIDLPGETYGAAMMRPEYQRELESPVKIANIGFGHGINATAIQMLSYYMAIANDGQWVQPHIVKAIYDQDGKFIHQFQYNSERSIMPKKISHQLIKLMRESVQEDATGKLANLSYWSTAGKTGTSQKIDPETRRYSRQKHLTSFIGFAPVSGPKRIVAIVLYDEPKKYHSAAYTAAPTFREIMTVALQKLEIPPDQKPSTATTNHDLAYSIKSVEHSISAIKKPVDEPSEATLSIMPRLIGLTGREVFSTFPVERYNISIKGNGIVTQQSPEQGTTLKSSSRIKLTLSPQPQTR